MKRAQSFRKNTHESKIEGVRDTYKKIDEIADIFIEGVNNILVGFPNGGQVNADGDRIVDYAFRNEYGLGVPARPFLKPAILKSKGILNKLIAKNMSLVSTGEMQKIVAMDQIGLLAVGQVKRYINALHYPPNSPYTVKQKKSANPLIDTGAMIRAVDYVLSHTKHKSIDIE